MMSSLNCVPCLTVDKDIYEDVLPEIGASLAICSFIGIDLELSGIGSKDNFKIQNVADRYAALRGVAQTRSVVSVGLSIFEKQSQPKDKIEFRETFQVHNYDILSLCDTEYILDEDAQTFLRNHGFNIDKQEADGVAYYKSKEINLEPSKSTLNYLFLLLLKANKPIVFHNGFLDLIFMYENFYAALPVDFHSFISDLHLMFPAGIYDTKFIAEYCGETVSFLEYVFYKNQRTNLENMMKGNELHIAINFNRFPRLKESYVEKRNLKTKILIDVPTEMDVCKHYHHHGWCFYTTECQFSHNIDFILDRERLNCKKSNRRLRARMAKLRKLSIFNESLVSTEAAAAETSLSIMGQPKPGAHLAGYDAFMTGYSFAYYIDCYAIEESADSTEQLVSLLQSKELFNRVYLGGKEHPLQIRASGYSKCSPELAKSLKLLTPAETAIPHP